MFLKLSELIFILLIIYFLDDSIQTLLAHGYASALVVEVQLIKLDDMVFQLLFIHYTMYNSI